MIRKINNATIAAIISLLFCWSIGLFIVAKQHVLPVWNIWLLGTLNILFTAGIINLILLPWVYFSKNSKLPLLFLHLLFSFFILIEFISLFYFSITLKLIDQSVFQFSVEQAYLIFNAYFVFKWYYLLIPLPLLFYIFIYKTLKLKNEKWFYTTFLVFGVAHLVFHQQIQKNNAHFNHLSQNKTVHLLQSFLPKNNKFVSALSEEDIQFYQENVNPQLQNLTHPLYHKVDPSNPLSPFFNLKETPPNLVFIIVEGLSSSYSGPNADEISYTPFLDSLANHSLYFDNSLATSERSFAALPSIIGSLPHGKGAFNASYTDFPKNETLATWLFNNGYIGDFFFGGYSRFDNMDLFMKNQGFKNIYDHEEYNYEGTGLQTSIDEVPFGIPDKDFLQEVIEITKNRKDNQPFFDVYFTLSMHFPYIIDNEEKYLQRVDSLIQSSTVDEGIKQKNLNYKKELATFLYTDNAIQLYFQKREQQKSHQNTIYVIVGDHMMNEIAQNSHIEKYRSTMMIYSPLLKKNKMIKGVNSHLDIAPSIYNLIQQEYQFPALDSISWLGHPFDTSATFNCSRNILFMLYNRKETEMVHHNFFLAKDKLYKLSDRLQVVFIEEPDKKEKLTQLLKVSTAIHEEVVTNNLLIPNSDY